MPSLACGGRRFCLGLTRRYLRYWAGTTLGTAAPAMTCPLLLLKVLWSLGLLPGLYNSSPEYHNYQLAATLGALMCCSAANVVVVRLRWRAAESRSRARRRSAALSPSWQPEI